MMTHSLITLSIQETAIASRRAFLFQVDVDGRPIVRDQRLSIAETQVLRGLTNQYATMFNIGSGMARFALDQQRALGVKLFHLWLAPAWERLRSRMHPGMRRTLVIASDVTEILNLPWELLRPPSGDFISFDPAFSIRHCPRPDALLHQMKHPLPAGPLRVLFMSCAPRNRGGLDGRREEAALLRTIAQAGPELTVETGTLGTFAELAERIATFQPHIVHLAGQSQLGRICPACHELSQLQEQHCRQCGGLLEGVPELAYFLFEDERGQADPRSALEIRRHLVNSSVQCVCVSSGQRQKRPPIAAVGGLCQALVSEEVPLAVSWACSLDDEVVTPFAATFYRTLAAGEPIDDALARARLAIRSACDLHGNLAWTLPVLYAATTQSLVVTRAPDCVALPAPRQHVVQPPLPGLTEGGAASLIARRRTSQHLLPALRDGTLRTVLLTGEAGSGKSVLATSLAHALAQQGFTPIPLASRAHLPLTAARLFQTCATTLIKAGYAPPAANALFDPRLSLRERLQCLMLMLNRGRFVLLLDGFEANLDPKTQRIQRPWLALFYTHLCYQLSGGGRAIITSRVAPKDLTQLPEAAAVQEIGVFSEAAFLSHLLHETTIERRYQRGELPPHLLRELHYYLGKTPRFLEQIRAALRCASVEDLRALLPGRRPSDDADQAIVAQHADRARIVPLVARLYSGLHPDSQQALCRAAIFDTPFNLEAVMAVSHVSMEQARAYVQQWQVQALIVAVGDALWSVPGWLRGWLRAPERLSAEEHRAAHLEAATFLGALEQQASERIPGLSWLDCLLEARTHYLAADDVAAARGVTCRINTVLGRWGLDDDLEQLNHELLGYELHPTPMRWIGQTYAMRGDYTTAQHWFERSLVVAGDRQPATAADVWRTLAVLDLKQGKLRSARVKLENALVLWQQVGDRAGEASTLAQLGVLAARLGHAETGLRLVALSALLFRQIDHTNPPEVQTWMQRLANHLEYGSRQFRCMIRQVVAEYRENRGWSLIHGAFHTPDEHPHAEARAAA
ncbi:MAG TPA: CHAT domain-containing protein [Herpetosiphonaceae bacterium]